MKLELLTDIDMLLIVEKVKTVEKVMQYIHMQHQTINIWKNMAKKKSDHILIIYKDANNL